ncbi:transmembrane protein 272-like [Larimichthys crocea]|uniref:transmembrane protein 272-like n=1 Tax=Larimichthys crocea TaxID=215358 RepID=UPI000F5DBF4D|nr:transmembrane protein 272-like [Larimichthys crocea]
MSEPTKKTICLCMVASIIPISQIVMGLACRLDCPKQNYIPIFLLVNGGVLMLLLYMLPWHSSIHKACFGLVSLFLFGWFIAGNVWIYSIYEPNYNETTTSTDPYCNKTLYQFAFWTITLHYIVLGLIICAVGFVNFLY